MLMRNLIFCSQKLLLTFFSTIKLHIKKTFINLLLINTLKYNFPCMIHIYFIEVESWENAVSANVKVFLITLGGYQVSFCSSRSELFLMSIQVQSIKAATHSRFLFCGSLNSLTRFCRNGGDSLSENKLYVVETSLKNYLYY